MSNHSTGSGSPSTTVKDGTTTGWNKMANERRNITQPDDWWAAFQAAADSEGRDLSSWIGEAAKAKLSKKKAAKLSQRVTRGKAPKQTDGTD